MGATLECNFTQAMPGFALSQKHSLLQSATSYRLLGEKSFVSAGI